MINILNDSELKVNILGVRKTQKNVFVEIKLYFFKTTGVSLTRVLILYISYTKRAISSGKGFIKDPLMVINLLINGKSPLNTMLKLNMNFLN